MISAPAFSSRDTARPCCAHWTSNIEFNSWINDDLRGSLGSIKESGRLADVICANLNFGIEDRQIILAALDNTDRVKALLEMIKPRGATGRAVAKDPE